MKEKEGRRVYADEDGELRLAEGDYGFSPKANEWQVRPPGCHVGGIPLHKVVEHEDKTISVYPSIVFRDADENGHDIMWHGYLKRGLWKTI